MRRIYTITSIISLLACCLSATAQDAMQTMAMADQYVVSGRYSDAIRLFERVLYFDAPVVGGIAYESLGDCYTRMNDLDRAGWCYDRAYNSYAEDSIKKRIIFKKASVLIFNDAYYEAFMELYALSGGLSHIDSMQVHLLEGIAHYRMGDFVTASSDFQAICHHDHELMSMINKDVDKAARISKRKSIYPVLMSMIVPGSGQIYCGHLKSGINSLLINTAFILLFANVAIEYTFIDALVSVGPWFQRYYAGGIKKVRVFFSENKQMKLSHQYNKILSELDQYVALEVY